MRWFDEDGVGAEKDLKLSHAYGAKLVTSTYQLMLISSVL